MTYESHMEAVKLGLNNVSGMIRDNARAEFNKEPGRHHISLLGCARRVRDKWLAGERAGGRDMYHISIYEKRNIDNVLVVLVTVTDTETGVNTTVVL